MFTRSLNISKDNSFFLFGPRGTGKSTFLETVLPDSDCLMLDLLDSDLFGRLQANPALITELVGRVKKQWCVVDEVQKVPPLLDHVHQLIERTGQKFALTGSSARKLKRDQANLLAGRAFVFKLFPLTHRELGQRFDLDEILSYGSLPKIFSYQQPLDRVRFLRAYAETYLKEEIVVEQLIRNIPPFRRFLEVSAIQDTEIVSFSNIARDILSDAKTVSNYYSILEDTLLGFQLESYHTSVRKRQKKAPKFYFFDLGVRRSLAGTIDNPVVPKSFEYGSLFENLIINEIHRLLVYAERSFRLSFLRVDNDLEIDLILERSGMPTYLIEIKSTTQIHETHLHSLKTLRGSIPNSRCIVLSNDKLERVIDGIACLPWRKGIEEMGV